MKNARGEFDAESENLVEGRNPVLEALEAGKMIDKLYIAREPDSALRRIAAVAREHGAAVVEVDRRKLDAMSRTRNHQGVIGRMPAREYAELDDVLEKCASRSDGLKPLLVICDGVTDPQNLGAIIRSAEAAGADAVITRERRAAGLTAMVAKASAGALEHIPVARVANIASLVERLKKEGFWIFGTAGEGTTSLYDTDFDCPAAIVVGAEGDGVSRLVLERCDYTVSIPMLGQMSSLNASAAAAVVLFEAVRQRTKKG